METVWAAKIRSVRFSFSVRNARDCLDGNGDDERYGYEIVSRDKVTVFNDKCQSEYGTLSRIEIIPNKKPGSNK